MDGPSRYGGSDPDLESLLKLGVDRSYNKLNLSDTTLVSMTSHINTLKRNGIPMTVEALTVHTVAMLDRLVDRKGNLLKDGYKRQIANTIKRIYPDQATTVVAYNKSRQQPTQSRLADPQFLTTVTAIGNEAVKVLRATSLNRAVVDLGMYDACLAVVFSMTTSMRIHELAQLKMSHLGLIESGGPVGISSKGGKGPRFITKNESLTLLIDLIREQRPLVRWAVESRPLPISAVQRDRFSRGLILISSPDYMRKKLKELAATVPNSTTKIEPLGFNMFRKLITSVLVNSGGHYIAQSLNNHSSLNTTLTRYTVVANDAAEEAFRKLQATETLLLGEKRQLPSRPPASVERADNGTEPPPRKPEPEAPSGGTDAAVATAADDPEGVRRSPHPAEPAEHVVEPMDGDDIVDLPDPLSDSDSGGDDYPARGPDSADPLDLDRWTPPPVEDNLAEQAAASMERQPRSERDTMSQNERIWQAMQQYAAEAERRRIARRTSLRSLREQRRAGQRAESRQLSPDLSSPVGRSDNSRAGWPSARRTGFTGPPRRRPKSVRVEANA